MTFVVPSGSGGYGLGTGGVVYVPTGVVRTAEGGFVLGSATAEDAEISITNDGTLVSLVESAILLEDDPGLVGNHQIFNGVTGIIRAIDPADAGILAKGSGTILTNLGQISGGAYGARFTGASALQVENAGSIIGQTEAGIGIETGTGVLVSNSGTISGLSGIRIVFGGTAEISNSGVIRGNTGIEADTLPGSLVLMNSGTISGRLIAISSGAADDRVTNTGTVTGEVLLGAGNDLWSGTAGWLDGAISGGGGNDVLRLGDSDDVANGDNGGDTLRGRGGEDALSGGSGNDRLFGGADDDDLDGMSGIDTLSGGAGDDRLTGGAQADLFVFAPGEGNDTVTDFTDGADRLDLTGFGFASFAQVTALAATTPDGLLIDLGGRGGGSILLDGFLLPAFTAGDVLI